MTEKTPAPVALESTINVAAMTMEDARLRYAAAKEAMQALEVQRGLLAGGVWNQGEMAGTLKRIMPMILKAGGLMTGGGGVAALMADPGAFAGIAGKLAGLFGG